MVNCFNSADIKLSLVSSHHTLSSSSSHHTLSSSHYHLIIILIIIIIISSYRCISTRRDYLRGGLGARSEAWSGQAQLLGRYVCPMDYLHSLTHMHPFIHTSIHPSIHTSIHTSIHASIHLSIYSSIHPFQAASTEATSRATRCMEKASSLARTVPSMTVTGKPTCGKAWVQRSTAMAGTYDAAMMMML